jgi:hypothetical protein
MLKNNKKVVKKQKPKTTQKQKQKQSMKVVVNIGKTTKSKSRAPRKAPEPIRPQIIPVYTPTYQSQPQQQYNNEDLRTLFRARTQANDNPLKELTREATLKPLNRPPVRLEESKAGYTDPKLDYEVLRDYVDPLLDTRKPERIMADAQFRAEADAEHKAFDDSFLKPEQAPALSEVLAGVQQEETPADVELGSTIKKAEEPEPASPPTYKQGAQQRLTSQEYLKLYGFKNQKDVRARVDLYNRDYPETPIKTTREDRSNKNIEELIKELEQKQYISQLEPELESPSGTKVKKTKGKGKK